MEELDLLAKINIDGIITTNWDDTAERIFPKFTRYVGQQELFFAPTFGMSEIYKIHGCMSKPESLVLTEEDYNDFNNRNTYLAAKLITIFVEHPIIFLGYSIADNNIQAILRSVVSCFQKDNLQRLQHNLIFVEWNPNKKADFRIDSYGITLDQGTILPVTRINTHDFKRAKLSILGLPHLGAGFPYLKVACGEPRVVWRMSAPLILSNFILQI